MKTVLITGASSGFGFSTSLILARRGYKVYACVRNKEKNESQELKNIAKEEQLQLELIELDITNQHDIDNLTAIASSIDVLVNNAGFGFLGPVEEFTIEEIQEQFNVNFFGTIRMMKAIIPSMRKKKTGTIINISSISGLLSFPLYGVYASSKFALEAYSEALQFELRPFHIHVALVEPGSFLTGFIKHSKFPKAQSEKNSPYIQLTKKFFGRYQQFDTLKNTPTASSTFAPGRVASRIVQLIEDENPSLHNIVGWDAHLLLFLNRIPRAIKTFFLRRAYKW